MEIDRLLSFAPNIPVEKMMKSIYLLITHNNLPPNETIDKLRGIINEKKNLNENGKIFISAILNTYPKIKNLEKPYLAGVKFIHPKILID